MKKICLLVATCLCLAFTFAQQKTVVQGAVYNSRTEPVQSASVRLLNTAMGSVTDKEGNFQLSATPGAYTIEVSAVGYATLAQTIVAGSNSSPFRLLLQDAPTTLDAVVVSAQKKEELLQATPLSITALGAQQVTDYRLWNSKDLTAIVPNLYAADPGDRRNVTSIRGITTTSYDPAVATYIDGVSQFNLDTYIAQLFDIERLEILRGPQGTLYGRNAMAGVVNIVTRQPSNKASGFAEVSHGNFGLQRYGAGVRLPLVHNKLYAGAAALYDQSNGFYTNTFNNTPFDKQHSLTGNYYLKYLPATDWAITLNVKHNNNRNNGTFPLVYGVDEALNNPFQLSQNATTELRDNIFNSSLAINYNGKHFQLAAQSAFQQNYRYYERPIDGDFSPIDGVTLINNYGKDWNRVRVFTQELRFSSPVTASGKLKWTAGAFYFNQDNPVKQATRFGEDAAMVGAPDKNFSLISSTRATNYGTAVFAQSDYQLTQKLTITAGIRYDNEKRKASILGEYQADPDPNPLFEFRSDTSASAVFDAFSPKVAAAYQFNSQQLLFASYNRGYRAGGLTPLSSDPSQPALFQYEPEYSNNIEIGLKNTFFADRLMINLTAFHTTVTDAQVPTLVLPDAITITRNTGRLVSKGIELETKGIYKGIRIEHSFGWNDASFSSLKVAQNGASVDLDGKRQIFTPDVTSMLSVQYDISLIKKYQLMVGIRGEWRYLGKQYFDLENNLSQPAYHLLNSRVILAIPSFSLAFWCRNLLDHRYISYAYDFGAVRLGDPATFGVTASARF